MNNITEHVVAVLHKKGTYEGREYDNFIIVTTVERDGDAFKTEAYKGSVSKIPTIFNVADIDTLRSILIGEHVLSYSFDKYGKLNSFLTREPITFGSKGGEK